MRRDHFQKRFKARSLEQRSLKKGTGGINPCFRPSCEASKSDLREFHQEDLKLRRSHQLARVANVREPTHSHTGAWLKRNFNPEWRNKDQRP